MRVLTALVAALFALAAGVGPAAARKTLRVSMQLPLRSPLGQNLLLFKEAVEKATRGEIEITIFDSAQLFEDKDVPKALASGAIDIGVASLTRFAGEVPAVEVFYVPFLFNSDSKLKLAVAPGSPVRGPLDAAILATGARVLWWQPYGGTVMLTKGGKPVRSPADLKGRKTRVISTFTGTWVSANGGTPISVPGGDQYFAYQRGTVDIGLTSLDTVRSRKLWEVMDTVTVANVASVEYIVTMNGKVYESLGETERNAIAEAAKSAEAKLRNEFLMLEREAIDTARENKMTTYVPSAAEMDALQKSTDAARDGFLKSAGDLGRQVYDAALALK